MSSTANVLRCLEQMGLVNENESVFGEVTESVSLVLNLSAPDPSGATSANLPSSSRRRGKPKAKAYKKGE